MELVRVGIDTLGLLGLDCLDTVLEVLGWVQLLIAVILEGSALP